jgi:hypothetical protein
MFIIYITYIKIIISSNDIKKIVEDRYLQLKKQVLILIRLLII